MEWTPESADGQCFECKKEWKEYEETKNDGLMIWPTNGNWYCRNCVPSEIEDVGIEVTEKTLTIDIYNGETLEFAQPILEMLRAMIAKIAGVTLQGNRLTIRWEKDQVMYSIHSVMIEAKSQRRANEKLGRVQRNHIRTSI